jgi:ectoine hydroxylase-related dioxygenase (phytanoyl-CoA dioxygenase family)
MYESIFKEDIINTQLKQNGWALIDFCNQETIESLNKKFSELLPLFNEMPLMITLLHKHRAVTQLVNDSILLELNTDLNRHFRNYKIPIAHFFVKKKSSPHIGLHQDPMITDQAIQPSYGLWIPLIDTDENNGTLTVLDGSHGWFHPFQADTVPTSIDEIWKRLIPECTVLRLKKGQAVLMDNRLAHYSYPVLTNDIRPAVVVKLTRLDNPYYTLYKKEKDIYLIRNNEGFYLNETWICSKSEFPSGEIIGTLDFEPRSISYNDYQTIKTNNSRNYFQTKSIFEFLKPLNGL